MSHLDDISAQLTRARLECEHIRRIATTLAMAETRDEMTDLIVNECVRVFGADAACLFLVQPDSFYLMVSERNCTEEFKVKWHRVPPDWLPFNKDNPHEALFFGTANETKREAPKTADLVEKSKRHTIAYAPLVVNRTTIGMVGFSYNRELNFTVEKDFVVTVVNLFAQALERAHLFEKERNARHEAEYANQAKTKFLANISHEIRTPLTAIQGFADLIHRSINLNAEQKHWSERILKNTLHLTGLVGDILDISKIEAETVEVHKQRFAISDLIDDTKAATIIKADEKNIKLDFEISDPTATIVTDPIHLRQIVINLIGNAIKFTGQGGVKVKIDFSNTLMCVRVIDSGIGIRPEDQLRIFEPFVQADNTTKFFGGTGLGLSISRRLAGALGGQLTLEQSQPDIGSTFLFELECEVKTQISKTISPAGHKSQELLSGFRVLLVDDSLDNQYLLNHVLTQAGAQVDVAENGLIGVERASTIKFDVVVMDIQMPVMDGNQAIAQLRALGYDRPVIALTACALSSERERSINCGFNDYLTKPIDFNRLVQTVAALAIEFKQKNNDVAVKIC